MIRSRVNLSTAICSDSSQLPITGHPQCCAGARARKRPGSREPGPVRWRKSRAFTRPRSGCTAHGLAEEVITTTSVLASYIWLLEGRPVNDLMTIVKMRRNLRRRKSKPAKVQTSGQFAQHERREA